MGRTVSYSVVKRNNPLDQDAVIVGTFTLWKRNSVEELASFLI